MVINGDFNQYIADEAAQSGKVQRIDFDKKIVSFHLPEKIFKIQSYTPLSIKVDRVSFEPKRKYRKLKKCSKKVPCQIPTEILSLQQDDDKEQKRKAYKKKRDLAFEKLLKILKSEENEKFKKLQKTIMTLRTITTPRTFG